jgi:hypothetical protein
MVVCERGRFESIKYQNAASIGEKELKLDQGYHDVS